MSKEKLESDVNKLVKNVIGLVRSFETDASLSEADVVSVFDYLQQSLEQARNKAICAVRLSRSVSDTGFKLGMKIKNKTILPSSPQQRSSGAERIAGQRRVAPPPPADDDGVDFLELEDD